MTCNQCGNYIPDSAAKCGLCGAANVNAKETQPATEVGISSHVIITCNQCGNYIPDGTAHCSLCGATTETQPTEYFTCPKCYKLTREKVDICSRCRFDTNAHATRPKETSSNKKEINKEKSEIERLNEIILELKQKGKQSVASRDKWRIRAEIAEKKLSIEPQHGDKKFKQVKIKFSKMYHPDSLIGDGFEKLIRQEIFKEFWAIIENIEKDNP